MKKFLLLVVAVGSFAWSASAQRYQGDVNIGYGLGIGGYAVNRFHVETVHGARINPYLFAGAGIGLSYFDNGRAVIPIFADIRGYLLKNTLATPYIFADLGYGFGDEQGFYAAGGLGVDFKLMSKVGLYLNLGYQSQGLKDNIQSNGLYGPSNMGALLVRVGFRF
ncbi:MAG: hypothetical protein HFJ82_03180 [Alistipes sp.]|jgi:hypothetical protein|uniref:hypothetical protein n=1 Tax=uncultured Alistipes sp. TaxID=538949 RepID=UPI0025964F3A|nr:hypothetical protein [uncultured Alistipes sp.]MCI9244495.1 hypothetical protein [Alistipes sp.]